MKAILSDVTRCKGCLKCVDACVARNGRPGDRDDPRAPRRGLSAKRLTAVIRTPEGRFLKRQCHHCIEPSCVSACLVGALTKSKDGPVDYDFDKCMGCRYCMLACPFEVPRYEWDTTTPRMRKCTMCHHHPDGPACVAACPEGATVYGEREELIAEAHRRIDAEPGKYLPKIWGVEDAGGTCVLFVSDVPLDRYWPQGLEGHSVTEITWPFVEKTPYVAVTVAGTLTALSWVIGRRNRLAEERAKKRSEEKGAREEEVRS